MTNSVDVRRYGHVPTPHAERSADLAAPPIHTHHTTTTTSHAPLPCLNNNDNRHPASTQPVSTALPTPQVGGVQMQRGDPLTPSVDLFFFRGNPSIFGVCDEW